MNILLLYINELNDNSGGNHLRDQLVGKGDGSLLDLAGPSHLNAAANHKGLSNMRQHLLAEVAFDDCLSF